MEGAIAVIVLALAVGTVGVGFGMLLAPRLTRRTERDDDVEGPQG